MYFGEIFDADDCNKMCIVCKNARSFSYKNLTNEMLKVLDCLETGRYNVTRCQIIKVLAGSKAKDLSAQLKNSDLHGLLSSYAQTEIDLFIRQALYCDVLVEVSVSIGEFKGKENFAKYLKGVPFFKNLMESGEYQFHVQIPGRPIKGKAPRRDNIENLNTNNLQS